MREGDRGFGDIDTAELYVVRVCEIPKSFPSSNLVSDLPKGAVNSSPEERHSRATVGTAYE